MWGRKPTWYFWHFNRKTVRLLISIFDNEMKYGALFSFSTYPTSRKENFDSFLFHICNRLNKNTLAIERPLTHKGLDTKGFCYHLSPARYFAGKGFVSGFLKRWERFVVLCQCTYNVDFQLNFRIKLFRVCWDHLVVISEKENIHNQSRAVKIMFV